MFSKDGMRCVWAILLVMIATSGSAFASNDLLLLDGRWSQILRVDGQSGRVTGVFVQPESGGLNRPRAATVGPDGHIYVASFGTDQVLKYDGRSGEFLSVFAADAALTRPTDLAFGPEGDLYVVDAGGILRLNGKGALVAELGRESIGRLEGSLAFAFGADGQLYIGGSESNDILRIDAALGSGEVFVDASSVVKGVQAVRFGSDGHLYVASQHAGAIVRFDGDSGDYVDTFAETSGETGGPMAFALLSDASAYVIGERAVGRYAHGGGNAKFRLTDTGPDAGGLELIGVLGLGADLVVSAIKAPASPSRGTTVNITDTVKNQGTEAASSSTARLFLSKNSTIDDADLVLGSRTVPPLDPALTSAGNTAVIIPVGIPVGKYNIIARADADEAVAESNEGNNTKLKAVKIGPDLLVKSLTGPSSVQSGTPFNLTDTTLNAGGEPAAAMTTGFYLSADTKFDNADIPLGQRQLTPLNPSASNNATTTLTIPRGTAIRVWYLLARADDGGDVAESLETNNVRSIAVALASGPPTAAAGPDQDVNRGTAVTLDGSASSDPDGQSLTWTWTQVHGPDVTSGTGVLTGVSPTFESPTVVSTLLFDLRVNDGTYVSAPDRVQINVMEDRALALFVAASGNDANPGTRTAPMLDVTAAINRAVAAGLGADVYIAAGVHTVARTITMAAGVSIYGGFDPVDWVRKPTSVTELNVTVSPAVLAQSITAPTELSHLTIRGGSATGQTNWNGNSAYGVKVVGSTALVIRGNTIIAGAGAPGINGFVGSSGLFGSNGARGADGLCDTVTSTSGGAGGVSPDGRNGGHGGTGQGGAKNGIAGSQGAFGTSGGAGGFYGDPGRPGAGGADGVSGFVAANGPGGSAGGTFTVTDWFARPGGDGGIGQPGNGGGGGGGGGGQDCWFFCTSGTGNGGGGGGGGGAGGGGGKGGGGGGGSFGVALFSSTGTQMIDNIITSGAGGKGGYGGSGGVGGTGGIGGPGGDACTAQVGAGGPGGKGGNGGRGGWGGGGAGGDSFAVLLFNTNVSVGGALNYGTAGSGGGGGALGAAGSAGPIKTN